VVLGWVGSVTQLEDLTKGALGRGVLGDCVVKVAYTAWHGSRAVTLSRADELTGKAYLVHREDEARFVVQRAGRIQSMYADENLLWLVSEAEWMLLVKDIGSGAAFGERPLLITHLDHTSRNEVLPKLPAVRRRAMA